MPERNKTPKAGGLAELERTQTEILVAETRAAEPFVKTFTAAPENVATEHLGSLLGVFEIDCDDEDAAYIVNFLVSVAKKEYFSNPRRGAIESFEATLHKINLALTELVKHGNVSWLGRLHGAIAIIEKNNLHFSATGEGAILLLRGDNATDISEGLASPEALEHPLKTFVEISSGRLMADDTIILTSPDLLALFPLDILLKNQKRFGKEGFRQFLRTALVNELDRASTLILDLAAPSTGTPATRKRAKRETASPQRPVNVFSGATFAEAGPSSAPLASETAFQEPEPAAEYTDEKTGHIYVQGETPESVPAYSLFWEGVRQSLGDSLQSLHLFLIRSARSLKRQGKRARAALAPRVAETAAGLRGKASALVTRPKEPRLTFEPTPDERPVAQDAPSETPVAPPAFETLESPAASERSAAPVNERLPALVENFKKSAGRIAKRGRKGLRRTFRRGTERFGVRAFYAVLGAAGLVCIAIGWLVFAPEKEVRENSASSDPATTEDTVLSQSKNAVRLADPALLRANAPGTRTLANLNDHLFAAAGNRLIDIEDGSGYAAPDGQVIRSLAAMDDLNLLFLYTEGGHLYSWSPFTRAYTENALSLPEGAAVREIGSYLTYLYVLDPGTEQIHRLPRAEAGFGEATAWLREPVELGEDSLFVINETIIVAAQPTEIVGYFQGRQAVTFEKPDDLRLMELFTEPAASEVYGLDRETGRIVLWNTEGRIVRQYFHPELKNASAFGVDTAKQQMIVASEDGRFFSFSFTKN